MENNNALLAHTTVELIDSIKLDESKIATMEMTGDGEIKVSVQNRVTHECYDIITTGPVLSQEMYIEVKTQIIQLLESHKEGVKAKNPVPSDNWSAG